MEYSKVMKGNDVQLNAVTWTKLTIYKRQAHKSTYCLVPFIECSKPGKTNLSWLLLEVGIMVIQDSCGGSD